MHLMSISSDFLFIAFDIPIFCWFQIADVSDFKYLVPVRTCHSVFVYFEVHYCMKFCAWLYLVKM